MPQVTRLTPLGLPGGVVSFTAKTGSATEFSATSGIARAGATRSGDITGTAVPDTALSLQINGIDRLGSVDVVDWQIVHGLSDEPSTLSARIIARGGFTVTRGHEIKVYEGGMNTGTPLFAGHILTVTDVVTRQDNSVEYLIDASDFRWLLDRYSLVTATYRNLGVNTIVGRIIADFADPASGFTKGYVPSSLGTVSFISFTNKPITECLQQLAETVDGGAFWEVDFRKRVSIWDEPDYAGNTITVNDGGDWRMLEHTEDLSTVVNRVVFVGGGSRTTATVSQGATTIPVEETGWYDPTGGSVQVGIDVVTYTGLSVGSGAGTITGCSGITVDIAEGDSVYNYAQADDAAAQTALATDLGGGQSGIAVHEASDHRLGYDRTTQAAESLLDTLKTPNTTVSYHLAPYPQNGGTELYVLHVRPGRLASVSLTTPIALSGSFRIRQVVLTPRSRRANGSIVWNRAVTAQRFRKTGDQALLRDAQQKAA